MADCGNPKSYVIRFLTNHIKPIKLIKERENSFEANSCRATGLKLAETGFIFFYTFN